MTFKTLATIQAVSMVLGGAACTAMPATMLANYGLTLSPLGLLIYQFWGVSLLGLGALTWSVRAVVAAPIQRAAALSLLLSNGLGGLLAVRGQLLGANGMGWSTVALFALLAVGAGCCALRAHARGASCEV